MLHRARGASGCVAQLNLAFLVATSSETAPEIKGRELRAAERACPGDPTALWLRGQWQSLGRDVAAASATFARLQRRFPGSAAGWSGQADVLVRLAYDDDEQHRPFTARNRFTRALALYRRARLLDPDPGIASGEARALDGLGDHLRASRVQARAAAARPTAPLRARVVEYLEHAGRFADAAARARRLAARPRFARGPALFIPADSPEPSSQDAFEALSAGAGRLVPVTLDLRPAGPGSGVLPGFVVADLGFIPLFRDVAGVTGTDRWCPAGAARRDLILDGRPAEAVAGLPARFADIRYPLDCEVLDAVTLGAVAQAEVSRASAGRAPLRGDEDAPSERPRGELYDARQNMWRFARRWDVARKVTAEWARAQPSSRGAFDRGGEVAFLAGDHAAAATMFAKAARLAREHTRGWSAAEASELLKRGTALKLTGRLHEAFAALKAADEVASRARADGDTSRAPPIMYHARAQTADTLLRQRRFADAIDAYNAAREPLAEFEIEGYARLEALDNNQAIAELFARRPGAGLAAARRAEAVDAMNPLFLQTEGFALARLGRTAQAADAYRKAVRSDPTQFGAWNDLGVMLARAHRDREAIGALRRAVGTRPDNAEAWFNLAIVLRRGGLRDALAAQGALARAFRLDPQLSGRRRQLITAHDLYFTNLDLSKPLPPKLDLSDAQKKSPLPAAGLAVVLLLGLRGARAAGGGLTSGAEKWLEAARLVLSRLPGAVTSFAPSAVAVATTVAALGWTNARDEHASAAALALLAAGLLTLVAVVMRVRVLAARRAGVTLRQRAWRPAVLVAVASAVVGLPWAALPVAETDAPAPTVHRSGPIAAATIGLCLLILSAWSQVPLAQALGVSAIVMAASMLTPIPPLDGAKMTGGASALTAGLTVAGSAILVAVGLQ